MPPTPVTVFPVGNPAGQKPSVCVRDITNGWDLYLRNPDVASDYPASTVKMMTMLLLREYKANNWSDTVTITQADVTMPTGLNLSSAGLQAGDVLTWQELAYAMMLPSGFDAAQAVARVIGDELGGVGGVARFVQRMNERATELNMGNTTFYDPFGGSKTFSPDTVRNRMSARDLATVAEAAFADAVTVGIAGATSHSLNITGPHARSIAETNLVRFLNGPTLSPAGIRDAKVDAGKSGIWIQTGQNVKQYNVAFLWNAPAGQKIIFSLIGSESDFSLMLDARGLIYSIRRDFPYLIEDVGLGEDEHWNNVALLIAGEMIDEALGHPVNNASPVADDPLVADSPDSILFAAGDTIIVDDDADLDVGNQNMTVECWYAGPGYVPTSECVFAIKTNPKEWAFNYFNGGFNIFASSSGSVWTVALALAVSLVERPVFFNGAVRHLAMVKNGASWRLYLNGERLPGTFNLTTVNNGTGPVAIGVNGAPIGRIDEWRLSIGVARYTSAMETIVARQFPRG